MEMYSRAACLIFLTVCLIMDVRRKKIWLFWVYLNMLTAVILAVADKTISEAFLGLAPGAVLMAAAIVTGEKIGRGDAWMCMCAGMYLGVWDALAVILLGCVFTCLWGALFALAKHISIKSSVIFSPFILTGYLILNALRLLEGGI